MIPLVDTHCHVDLYPDYEAVIGEAEAASVYTIAVTNTPSVFSRMKELVSARRYLRAALGLHPELAAQRFGELGLFKELLPQTKYVGEVGLDYARGIRSDHAVQRRAFGDILAACAAADEPKVLSVHSRRAADDVVSAIGDGFRGNIILHWYSGSLTTLKRAIVNGYYFSVNIAMASSASGLRIVKAIPRDRLLTETDGPFVSSASVGMRPTDLCSAVKILAPLRGESPEALRSAIYANFRRLLESKHARLGGSTDGQ